jgi:hypothetical protein
MFSCQHLRLTAGHPFDSLTDIVVTHDRDRFLPVIQALDAGETVLLAVFGVAVLLDNGHQLPVLRPDRIVGGSLKAARSPSTRNGNQYLRKH